MTVPPRLQAIDAFLKTHRGRSLAMFVSLVVLTQFSRLEGSLALISITEGFAFGLAVLELALYGWGLVWAVVIGGFFYAMVAFSGLTTSLIEQVVHSIIIVGAVLATVVFTRSIMRSRQRRTFDFTEGRSQLKLAALVLILWPLIPTAVLTLIVLAGDFDDGRSLGRIVLDVWQPLVGGGLLALLALISAPMRSGNVFYFKGILIPPFAWPSFALYIGALVLTGQVWGAATNIEKNTLRRELNDQMDTAVRAVGNQLEEFKAVADALAAAVRSHPSMTQGEWTVLTNALRIRRALGTVKGLGFIEPAASPADVERLTLLRDNPPLAGNFSDREYPAYIITMDSRDVEGISLIGLDAGRDSRRKNAMIRARKEGKSQLVGPLRISSTPEPAIIIYTPVYTQSDATVPRDFIGWIYSSVTLRALVQSNLADLSGRVAYRVEMLGDGTHFQEVAESKDSWGNPLLRHDWNYIVRDYNVAHNTFRFTLAHRPDFLRGRSLVEANFALLGGVTFSVLLWVLMMHLFIQEQLIRRTVRQQTSAIAEREKEYRSLVDTANVGILGLDENDAIRSINPAGARILGIDQVESIGKPISPAFPQLLAASAADAQHDGGENLAMIDRDEGQRTLEVAGTTWEIDGHRRKTVIFSDHTERLEAVRKLAETERRWDLALHSSEVSVFDIDLRDHSVKISDNFFQITQMTVVAPEGLMDRWLQKLHPDDVQEARRQFVECLRGRRARFLLDLRLRLLDGRTIWQRCSGAVAERTADGRATRFLGVVMDVTRLHEAHAAIERSEELFRHAFVLAPVGLVQLDENGMFVAVNEAFCRLVGRGESQLIGTHWKYCVTTDSARQLNQLLNERSAPDDQSLFASDVECTLVHSDGTERYASLGISTPRKMGGGRHFVVQVLDVTQDRLVNQIKRDFVANVSHELRTPLTSIQGALKLLRVTEPNLGPKGSQLIDLAQRNGERLISLVNDILDLEKASSGGMDEKLVCKDLRMSIREAVASNATYAERFGVSIRFDPPDAPVHAMIEERSFAQIMANLLSNAAKFSPAGSSVALHLCVTGDMAEIHVIDSGNGIPADFHDSIFSRFTQADSSATRARGGTGLGLHLSRELAKALHGTLDFNRARPDGTGADFVLALPIVPTDAELRPDRAMAVGEMTD